MATTLSAKARKNTGDPLVRLQRLREADLTEKILLPLFEAMGFEGVENRHGPFEKGKDIVAWSRDKFGETEVTVAAVKRERLSGRASAPSHLTTVCTQLMQCLNEPVVMKDGTTRLPSSIWFISPFPLDQTALELSLQAYNKALANRVKIIDGPKLIRAIKTHYPDLLSILGEALPSYLEKVRREIPLLHEARALHLASSVPLEHFFVEICYKFGGVRAKADLDAIEGKEKIDLATLSRPQIESLLRLDSALRSLTKTGLSPKKITGNDATGARPELRLRQGILAGKVELLSAKNAIQALRTSRKECLSRTARAFRQGRSIAERRAQLNEFINWQQAADSVFQEDAWQLIVGRHHNVRTTNVTSPSMSVLDLIDTGVSLLVRGDAGSGKTTLLRMTASRLAQQDSKIPVYVPLSAMVDDDIEAGLGSAFRKYGYEISGRHLKKLLSDGRLVVLLDGLDEVVKRFQHMGNRIAAFVSNYAQCQTIISARPWVTDQFPPRFLRVDIQPFTDEELTRFFASWFSDSPGHFQAIMEHIHKNPSLKDVVRTPLLATVLASLREAGGSLPDSLVGIYGERFRLLLHDWSAVKGVTRDVYEVKDKRIFLRRMAFDLHCRNLVAVSWPEWHAAVGRFVGAVVPPREATDFLKELVESNNAIFQNANGKWGLGHLQYQEYLAAVELAENRDLSVLDKVGNSWWSEILEMYAEITQDVGHVIRHFRNSDRLRFVLKDLMRMLKRAPHTNPSERKLLEDAQAIEASFETDPDLELSPLEQV